MMIDRTGMRYGNLVVKEFSHRQFRSSRHGYYLFWKCVCDCGNETIVLSNNLNKKNTTSCGCKSSRFVCKDINRTHGMYNSPEYISWRGMKDRCYLKSHKEYKRYGAIGITVCERWKNSFENFFEDMGKRPQGFSIERIDNLKGYSPENCKWASQKEQANNKSTNKFIEFEGKKLTIQQWAEKLQISHWTLRARLARGWPIEKTLRKFA